MVVIQEYPDMEKGGPGRNRSPPSLNAFRGMEGAKQILPSIWVEELGDFFFEFLDPLEVFGQKARNPQINPEKFPIFCEFFPIFSMKKRWPIF